MRSITKRYGHTLALDRVNFDVNGGEIHALLGENGAGKSTLMHVLSGLTAPDSGAIEVDGKAAHIPSSRQASSLGIAMVHQHFSLVPAFTIAENLALGLARASPGSGRSQIAPIMRIRRSAVEPSERDSPAHIQRHLRAAQPALERASALGWRLDPDARVADLPVGVQQRVEIARALATGARILIFDEPTAVLSAAEIDELFAFLRALSGQGAAVVLIAHKLAEIMAASDRVTVLRRGIRVASAPTSAVNADRLAEWMVGVAPTYTQHDEPHPSAAEQPIGAARLELRNIHVAGDLRRLAVTGVTETIQGGEILGIGGVDGNGQTELAEAVAGLRPIVTGAITWNRGAFLPGVSPRVGYIPQDRRRSGLAVTLSVRDNLLLNAVRERPYRRGPMLRLAALRQHALALAARFDVRTTDLAAPALALSGGNQQKIVVARALEESPELVVAVNPTRGLDIAAAGFVRASLRDARARGAAVLLISTDLDELIDVADRAAIMSGGKLHPFDIARSSSTEIGRLLGGVSGGEAGQSGAGHSS